MGPCHNNQRWIASNLDQLHLKMFCFFQGAWFFFYFLDLMNWCKGHLGFEIRFLAGFMKMFMRWIFKIFFKILQYPVENAATKRWWGRSFFFPVFQEDLFVVYADFLFKNWLANQNFNLRYSRRLLQIWLGTPTRAQLCRDHTQTRWFRWSKWGTFNCDASTRTQISCVFSPLLSGFVALSVFFLGPHVFFVLGFPSVFLRRQRGQGQNRLLR